MMHEWITLETQCCSPLCSISNQFEFSDCPKIHLGCDMPMWHAAGVSIFSQYCQYCDMQQVWVFSKTKLNGESSPTCGGLTKAVAAMFTILTFGLCVLLFCQYPQYLHSECVTIWPIFIFRVCYYQARQTMVHCCNALECLLSDGVRCSCSHFPLISSSGNCFIPSAMPGLFGLVRLLLWTSQWMRDDNWLRGELGQTCSADRVSLCGRR